MQSYVTSHVKLQYANIPAYLNRNGIRSLPDVLFPTEGRGEKSAGHETNWDRQPSRDRFRLNHSGFVLLALEMFLEMVLA